MLVLAFNKLLQKSKNEFKYCSVNTSLLILYKSGTKLINSILIESVFEFLALKILSTRVIYKYWFLKKSGKDKYNANKILHMPANILILLGTSLFSFK